MARGGNEANVACVAEASLEKGLRSSKKADPQSLNPGQSYLLSPMVCATMWLATTSLKIVSSPLILSHVKPFSNIFSMTVMAVLFPDMPRQVATDPNLHLVS